MHRDNFQDVVDFMTKFEVAYVGSSRLLSQEVFEFRWKFLHEELREFELAHDAGDLVKTFDALLDLAYVVFGTAQLMGLPWHEGWRAVQAANMRKVRGPTKRGGAHGLDVMKPPGWVGPEAELMALLTTRTLDSLDDIPREKTDDRR